jgi:hypothetical protein
VQNVLWFIFGTALLARYGFSTRWEPDADPNADAYVRVVVGTK